MAENPRIEELRRRVQMDPASIAFAALAEEYRRMGRHEEAIETCRAGLQRHPAYLSARVTLGRALIETGDFEGAREELETVLKSAPENLAAIRGLALIHERLGHSAEMDPQFAALMNAEVERAQAARAAAPEPPPHAPVEAPALPVAEAQPQAQPHEPIEEPPAPPVTKREPIRLSSRPAPVIDPPLGAAPVPEPASEPEPDPDAIELKATELELGLELDLESFREAEPEPSFEIMLESDAAPEPGIDHLALTRDADHRALPRDVTGPDPAMLATVARLERFLAAIDAARHA
jgi:tetratricopeptide (TPR) repeat protein